MEELNQLRMDIEFFFFFFYCFDVSIDYEVLLYNKPVNEVKKDGKKNERKIFQFVLGVLSTVSHSSLKNIHSMIEIILL